MFPPTCHQQLTHLAFELEVATQLCQLSSIERLGVCCSQGFHNAQLQALCIPAQLI
jgi:hypothetical protein